MLFAAALFIAPNAGFADTFQADTPEELIQAMELAQSRAGRDVIVLEPDKEYAFENTYVGHRALPLVTDKLRIEGNGATWRWSGNGIAGFIRIDRGGQLELDGLALVDATGTAIIVKGFLDARACRFENNSSLRGGALRIASQGQVRLSNCAFNDNGRQLPPYAEWREGSAIFNLGELQVNRSSFVIDCHGGPGCRFEKSLIFYAYRSILINLGQARLVNVTVYGRSIMNVGQLSMINNTLFDVEFGPGYVTSDYPDPVPPRIGNSVVSARNVGPRCPEVDSLGHNFFLTDPDHCNPEVATDRVVASPVTMDLEATQGLSVAKPRPGSPIVDAGSAALCPDTDALGRSRPIDGDEDGEARCDVGAVEFLPGPVEIDKRMTGLWFEPARDGHYFIVERPRPDYMVVFWATYDANGDPLWLYGSGSIQGDRTEPLVLYRQTGMTFPSFDREDLTVEEWGTLQLSFDSCDSAVAEWHVKGKPALDGSAEITHLAYRAGSECFWGADQANGATKLDRRWLNGTWYDAENDGHYVSTLVLPGGFPWRVFALWWTYTPSGEQLWLYGIGTISGEGLLQLTVYESRGMALPELDTAVRRNIPWGTITLDFRGCEQLQLSWDSEQAGFPSGHAELERLTGRDLCS